MPSKPRTKRTKPVKAPEPSANGHAPPPCVAGLEWGTATVAIPPSFDWHDRFMSGATNIIEGRKGVGKSSLLACIAAHFAGGPALPGQPQSAPQPVLWHGSEEVWEREITPRLLSAGADMAWCGRLKLLTAEGRRRKLTVPSGMPELIELLQAARVKMLVLDPFWSLADPTFDLRIPADARSYMECLNEGLAVANTSGYLTRNLRKGRGGDPLDSGLGSSEIGNTARTISLASRHPEDDGAFVLASVATNWGAPTKGYVYRLRPTGAGVRVDWVGESELDAETLTEGRAAASDRDEGKDAQALVRALLADGPRAANDLIEEGKQAGIGIVRLRNAKVALGVKSQRRADGPNGRASWYWHPPAGGWPTL